MKKLLSLTLISLFFLACTTSSPKTYTEIAGPTMGSIYKVTYWDSLNRDARPWVDSILNQLNYELSTYDSTAVLARINNLDSIFEMDIPPHLFKVLQASILYNKATNGLFDITISPYLKAWGFYNSAPDSKPSDSELKAIQACTGISNFRLVQFSTADGQTGFTFHKLKECLDIDVNAIAPGYAADVIAAFLTEKGIVDYLLDIGGEMRLSGNYQGNMWKVGIQKPVTANSLDERQVFAVCTAYEGAIATSGNYQKFREIDGVVYGHTFNPTTGKPELNEILSVTTFCPTAMAADAFATCLMVMGLEKAKAFIEATNQLEALIIYRGEDNSIETWNSLAFPIQIQ